MTARTDSTPLANLDDAERALWDKASDVAAQSGGSGEGWLTYDDFRGANGYTMWVARYLAALSPERVLSLLAALSAARQENRELRAALSGAPE